VRTEPSGSAARPTATLHSISDRLSEATGLAEAIDLDVVQSLVVPVPAPRPATLFGTG
jgi:GTP-binding protein HflX